MMNIRQIEVFWAIMRTGSATGAANILGVSQPAISKVLRHLEDTLGMKLFLRRSGRLLPTEEAEHLYARAEVIFDNVETLRQAAMDFRDSQSGRIQVVATPALGMTFLPAPLGRFLLARPRVELSLKILTTSHVVARVSQHQADIGVAFGPVRDPSIVAQDICRFKFACFVPVGHRLASRPSVMLEDLVAERVISFHRTAPAGLAVRQVLAEVGASVAFECDHTPIACALVAQGAGVALMPPLQRLDVDFPGVVLRPVAGGLSIAPQVLYRKNPRLTRLGEALLQEILAYGASLGTD